MENKTNQALLAEIQTHNRVFQNFASENPRYESLKTNKRLAIQKLKLKLA